ncbi:MAG: trypsin-like peptidase domain-containing protein [Chthoniobacter sp.]|uniref:trypsin-like peptidase domain-containing protein n=1 Tax=Chthoniobacter sp. TaxID=2510640 RepID=UPI0032AA67C9
MKATAMAVLVALGCTPVFGQNIGQFPGGPNPAPAAEANDAAEIAKALGPLADSLTAAISMDHSTKGSVVYSQPQVGFGAVFFGDVQWLNDGGRQCANFADPMSNLKAMPPMRLGPNYTLATWIKLPCPGNHGVIWDGTEACPLFVAEDRFACSDRNGERTFCTVKGLTGWHHVAVTCDGTQMAFFLDGGMRGQVPMVIDDRLWTIGAKTFRKPTENTQCDCLDDMFIFNRPLKQEEIAKLSNVRLPIHPPTAEEIARQNATKTARANAAPVAAAPVNGAPPPNMGALPPNVASLVNPAPVVPAADRAGAAELVKTYHDSLVFVQGTNGSGSGFLAKFNKGTFLFTNAHVAAGVRGAAFKTLNGDKVQIGATSAAAVGHDVVLMQATSISLPFEIMQGVDKEASIGDAVVVLGNAEGAGVVNTIMGSIVGIGPNLVEVDAPFVPGNSGSPIIHLKSGKVIGVATYLTIKKVDVVTKKVLSNPTVRRFGYRLDSIKSWQSINWSAFTAQADTLENIENMTKDLIKLVNEADRTGRFTPDMTNNRAIRSRIEAWQGQFHGHMSKTDIDTANANFIGYLKSLCKSDVIAAHQSLTYDFFQRKLTEEERDRNALADIFNSAIQAVRR